MSSNLSWHSLYFTSNICDIHIIIWGAYSTFCLFCGMALWNWSWGLWHHIGCLIDLPGYCFWVGFVLAMGAIYRNSRMREVAALFSYPRFSLTCSIYDCSFNFCCFAAALTFMCFIQFLGREKDDGARLSAISGKKVRLLFTSYYSHTKNFVYEMTIIKMW